MSLEEIESTVRDVVVRYLQVPPEGLNGATTWTDLKADSLARIEVTLVLEDTFKLAIPDEEAAKFKTLSDVVSYIHGRESATVGVASPP